MDATRPLVVAMLLLALGPPATPGAATHSCVDDVPCYPHVDLEPKPLIQLLTDRVRCLILAQAPTA